MFIIFAVGTVTQLLLSRFASRRVVMAGLGLFLAGTVVGGIAIGAVFLGSLATANRQAPAERRGQTISTDFELCYYSLIVPVVGVGVASKFLGDFAAVLAFSILLAALCVLSLIRIPWDLSQGSAAA